MNGHAGQTVDSPIIGAVVSWKQDGLQASVIAPPGKSDDALALARAVRINADVTKTSLETLPAGMEVIAQWGTAGYPGAHYSIAAEKTGAAGRTDSVRIAVNLVPVDFPAAILGAGHEVDGSGRVRDRAAFAVLHASDIGGRTLEQRSLGWSERADLVVTISGTVSGDELRKIAEGLE